MAITSEKDLRQWKKRFQELADKAYMGSQFTFTDFLGMSEQAVFYQFLKEYGKVDYTLFGGHELCERKMLRFGSVSELMYEQPFPIVCIRIRPLVRKFADKLGHRDYLGALMNIGIERSTCGDIFIQEQEAYLYAEENMAPFILENLTKVKHTNVVCELCFEEVKLLAAEPVEQKLQVSSERIDGVLAKVFQMSRSQSLLLFQEKKVFVSGRLCENNSCVLHKDDMITARGYGKFCYRGICGESKKGKLYISIERYGIGQS